MHNSKILVIFICLLIIGVGRSVESQPSKPLRGKISSLTDQEIRLITNSGEALVRFDDATKFVTEVPMRLSEIKSGLYLGTTAQKQPDGTFRASEVHVFAEDERGLSEGHRPSSSVPNSTMTNASVESVENVMVQDLRGPMMTLKYSGGEVKVFIAPNTPITKRVAGSRGMLKPGLNVSVAVSPSADGSLRASQITIRNRGE